MFDKSLEVCGCILVIAVTSLATIGILGVVIEIIKSILN